jgi:hypothetical protein
MAYDPARRPRHPVAVAELNDSASLAQLATQMDGFIDGLSTAAARQAAMHAITILRGASRHLTP